VERTFANLIGNALEAMAGTGECVSRRSAGWGAVVHVEDTGPDREEIGRSVPAVCEFGEANGWDWTGAIAADGAGSRRDMWVESVSGRGARFSFRLPGARVAAADVLPGCRTVESRYAGAEAGNEATPVAPCAVAQSTGIRPPFVYTSIRTHGAKS